MPMLSIPQKGKEDDHLINKGHALYVPPTLRLTPYALRTSYFTPFFTPFGGTGTGKQRGTTEGNLFLPFLYPKGCASFYAFFTPLGYGTQRA